MERIGPNESRKNRQIKMKTDLIVAGGGMAGICAAVTAAREGLNVILVQDRPVLGGNASSEVRLWVLGATSHMGNNNRWAREGGVIDEIMTENLWRNPEGNPVLFDAVLLDLVWKEPGLTLLLDTVVHKVETFEGRIQAIQAYSSQSSTDYYLEAPLFCDATGDGLLGYSAGASFRIGAEKAEEFGELLAPDHDYGELLGSTIFFYSKDTGDPVSFTAPDFALKDVTEIPRYERIKATEHGCSFWWLEYGGRLDTIHDTAEIKKELLRVVYGIWNHIKNSGLFPEAINLTLEWVGMIPGKRESRRFEGDYILTQPDIIDQRKHTDAVSFGGWAIDIHPADGVYSEKPPCNQYHSKGVYQIPYRCLYSRDISNLFLAGRLISVSHIALGSTRVMMTGGHNGQAVGMAAAVCTELKEDPRALSSGKKLEELQRRLVRSGQFIPHLSPDDPNDLVQFATIETNTTLVIDDMSDSGNNHPLTNPEGMLIPFETGPIPAMSLRVDVEAETSLIFQLRRSDRYGNFSPDDIIEDICISVPRGLAILAILSFQTVLLHPEYLTVVLMPTPGIRIHECETVFPGILHIRHKANTKVAKSAVQEAPDGSGLKSFEFWLPERKPMASLWSMTFDPPLQPYSASRVLSGMERPFIETNSWASGSIKGIVPELTLRWDSPKDIGYIIISMDGDYDNPMESVQLSHSERVSPLLPESVEILNETGQKFASIENLHSSRWEVRLKETVKTASLVLRFTRLRGATMAIYRIRVFSDSGINRSRNLK